MGSRHSRIKKSPHEVLGLSPVSTRKEIRDRYKSLILKVHPDVQKVHSSQASKEAVEIMDAYTSIMKSPPLFEFYNEELFREDLRKYAEDFFERISDYCGIPGAPKFCSPDFERFYHMFTNFRTQKAFGTEEERSEFCRGVRRVARIVRDLDKRIGTDSFPVEIPPAPARVKERKTKTYPFNCTHCEKGFHSQNQIINHFRSRKHFERVGLTEKTPRKYIENQIQEVTQQNSIEVVQKPHREEKPESLESCKIEEQGDIKKTTARQEPIPFRTCAKCRTVLSSRSELLMHLRTDHKEP
ncbi:hypothetical protein M970_010400 [Encephalitozoon cuniculi EcunIII-L]|uniref:Dnaj like protein n=1 Tax=Encephalitozoon cuniculi TaxID=6035 RepID=M1K9S4_ENCCN|nr:dnaj like protein [Encephalitozoon cuniculi]KMV66711.1 hypothetical protein M970_010400 [Encephalitozoon cuniculi EcunIII-L]UYI28427.1 putative DnaJ domain-containing protein [Encephalitozoon cuniculi]